jgi:hypothetical protein
MPVLAVDTIRARSAPQAVGNHDPRPCRALAAHSGADARSIFSGDGGAALRALADDYDRRIRDGGLAACKTEAA